MMSADGLPRGPAYLQTLSTWLARTRLDPEQREYVGTLDGHCLRAKI